MALSGMSLNAATATGPGAAISFDVPHASHSVFLSATGSPSTAQVALEGTVNGTDWFAIGTATLSNPWTNVGNLPLVAARANLTALSGGTSPTVSAWIAAA